MKSKSHSIFIASATLFLGLAAFNPAFAEAAAAGAGHANVKKESLIDMIRQGGWVMYPLFACSVAMIYLIIDVVMRTGKKRMAPDIEVEKSREFFRNGDYVGAYQNAKANDCSYNTVVKEALSYVGEGKEQTEQAIISGLSNVNSSIQSRINYLSVIGVCTPMIGLLGTVAGMKGAFGSMGTEGAGDVGALAGHIGEVLIATAGGLFIAIPAFMAFYMLRNKLQVALHNLQEQVFNLFRKMPYEQMDGAHVGEEEVYANVPNWVGNENDTVEEEIATAA